MEFVVVKVQQSVAVMVASLNADKKEIILGAVVLATQPIEQQVSSLAENEEPKVENESNLTEKQIQKIERK